MWCACSGGVPSPQLFVANASAGGDQGIDQVRGLIRAIGAAASVVLTRALLDPDGRMKLWLGLKALADSAPMEGRLPGIVGAFTKQRHAFELGLHGSLVLSEAFKVETDVPMSRLFVAGSSPPAPVTSVAVGDVVRVRYPYHKADKADTEEALFTAVITAVHQPPPHRRQLSGGSSLGRVSESMGALAAEARRSLSAADGVAAGLFGGSGGGDDHSEEGGSGARGGSGAPAAASIEGAPTPSSPRVHHPPGHVRAPSFSDQLIAAAGSPSRSFRPAPPKVDIQYRDDVELTFGDQPEEAGLNVLDQIPEVGAMWRLWIRGLSLDVTVPPDRASHGGGGSGGGGGGIPASAAVGAASTGAASSTAASAAAGAVGVGVGVGLGMGVGMGAGIAAARVAGPSSREHSARSERANSIDAMAGEVPLSSRPVSPDPSCHGREPTGAERSSGGDEMPAAASAASTAGEATKTVTVDYAEPSAEEVHAGVFGSLVFTISLPLVFLKAHLKAGRFWSDSSLLKLGRFTDALIVFDNGEVHSRVRISFERDGAFLAIEQLSLAVKAIRIESMSDHSKRWGALLGTVSGLQWLLSGFLERKLLALVSEAVVANTGRVPLVAWAELPQVIELRARMQQFQETARRREQLEHRAVQRLQRRWRAAYPAIMLRQRHRSSPSVSATASASLLPAVAQPPAQQQQRAAPEEAEGSLASAAEQV